MALQSTDYRGRFKDLQALEDRKDDLIEELLASLDALKAQRDEAKSDLETEREARRRLQRTIRDGQPKGPRFALLILHLDADVFLFEDEWIIGDPATGGEKIAVELISKITSFIQPILESSSNVQVIVKIYGDLFKLWRTYEAAGSNLGSSDLTRFFSHFNRKDSLIDFVDFGPRKGSIERKLSGVLGHYLTDERIEHILLGSPHTSIPPILSPHDTLLYTADQKSRLTLLTTNPNPKDWSDFGYKTTSHFDSLFASPQSIAQSSAAPSSSSKAPSTQAPLRTHSKHKLPPPTAPAPPQAANVPRLRIRQDMDPRQRGPVSSYPPGAGAQPPVQFAPAQGTLARRDTFPRYSGIPPPAPSIPSIHWP